MDHLRPGTVLFLGLRLVSQHSGFHDIAKGEKGRRVGVTFRVPVTQRFIVGVQNWTPAVLIFIVLQGTLLTQRSQEVFIC